jgi:hypothetical protein
MRRHNRRVHSRETHLPLAQNPPLQGMNMFRLKPNVCAQSVPWIVRRPNLVTHHQPDLPVPLFLDGPKVLTVVAVALVAPPDLDLEEVHSLGSLQGRRRSSYRRCRGADR